MVAGGLCVVPHFDIWKPGPIGWADKKLSGGNGIMMDDVLAGIFSAVLLHLGWWLSGLLG